MMAGLVVSLRDTEALDRYREGGAYSTFLARPKDTMYGWRPAGEGTIADYLALRDGDLLFFFVERVIYGLGRVVALPRARRAALCNYRYAWDLGRQCDAPFLWQDEPDDICHHPFVVFVEPHPAWWTQGIDMDEALGADARGYVTVLPFFSGVSFARVDEFETAHLAALLSRAANGSQTVRSRHKSRHAHAAALVKGHGGAFDMDVDALVRRHAKKRRLRHEALLEAWLVDALTDSQRWQLVRNVFGRSRPWTFVGWQVPASPFKPPQWIDRMDILAYDVAPRPETDLIRVPVAHSYFAAELKKGRASVDDVMQAMKYVDWLAHKYQGGDYAGISAAVIAADFPREVREHAGREGLRRYIRPRRPYGTSEWRDLLLIRYQVERQGAAISLEAVPLA